MPEPSASSDLQGTGSIASLLACPSCRVGLALEPGGGRQCARCNTKYRADQGIWRLMAPGREEAFREFVRQYETVRSAEGRRVQRTDHLRALPYRDLSKKRSYEWGVRARSFRSFLRHVVVPMELRFRGPLQILDLGSGLGWLSYRLSLRGHHLAAVDLLTNDFDGLGVHRHYDRSFLPVQAEFDRLPFRDGSMHLVVYNAAFHYATDYAATLGEAMRVLGSSGHAVIMDSPLYRDAASGAQMVREREDDFERRHRFRGDSLPSEGFLTYRRLGDLASTLGLRWEIIEPWYGLRWWFKPRIARLRGWREPARFKLIVARRAGHAAPLSGGGNLTNALRDA